MVKGKQKYLWQMKIIIVSYFTSLYTGDEVNPNKEVSHEKECFEIFIGLDGGCREHFISSGRVFWWWREW
jgi:hypothetical protein